jgi:predicted O-methyltransferase YrrM
MPRRSVSNLSIVPGLLAGFLGAAVGRGRRRCASRILREIKVAAGRIPAMPMSEFPGIKDLRVTTRFKGGAIVACIAKATSAKRVFEFGTHLGETAMEVAENCPEATVVTLDLPEPFANDFQAARMGSAIEVTDSHLFSARRGSAIAGEAAARITQIRQDSATFDPERFSGQFDLIYVDASHSYSAVRSDSEKAFVMVKDDGLIIWDDYCYPGVWRYLNDLARSRPELRLRYIYDWDKVVLLPRSRAAP